MAKIARYNGDVRAFGSTAAGTDRTIFGDVAQSDTLDDNLNANFLTGWGILTAGAKPPKQYFNGALYTATQFIAYLHEQGIAEWNTSQKYYINSHCKGSDGLIYKALTGTDLTPNTGNDPISDAVNWELITMPLSSVVGKNLLINGRKLIQQRGVTGGTKQVVLNTANLGGAHTISFTGTATVTIKEATTLAASDALTSWDAPLVSGAASGTTVTLTANKYVHIEFSTTDFNFAQLELGGVATNFEYRHNEFDLCQKYYFKRAETTYGAVVGYSVFTANAGVIYPLPTKMRVTPILNYTVVNATDGGSIHTTSEFISISIVPTSASSASRIIDLTANAEIFNADDGVGINYKEDRWYV